MNEEIQKIINCPHDFYGDNPEKKDGSRDVAKAKEFCVKCGNDFIRIIEVLSNELLNPNAESLSPKCKVCDFQTSIDKTDLKDWTSIDISKEGIIDLIWICPNCMTKKVKGTK